MTDYPIPNKLEPEVIPSPGTSDVQWEAIEKKIEQIKSMVKSIHIDVVDGKFAPNTTFMDPAPFAKYTKDIIFEVHLMTENPLQYIKPFADSGFSRIIGQIEKMSDIAEFVAKAQEVAEVGLAVDIATPAEKLFPYFDDIDFAFAMTVKAGLSGQAFVPDMLTKIKKLREKDLLMPIEVDGGVNEATIVQLKDAGATRFVSTGFIFDSPDPKQAYNTLCEVITSSKGS